MKQTPMTATKVEMEKAATRGIRVCEVIVLAILSVMWIENSCHSVGNIIDFILVFSTCVTFTAMFT